MTFPDFVEAYQWNYRPQHPRRPEWFTEWPGGARMAVMLILLHEWECPCPQSPGRCPKERIIYLTTWRWVRANMAPGSASGVSWTYSTGITSRRRSSQAVWSPSYSRKACEKSKRGGTSLALTGGTNPFILPSSRRRKRKKTLSLNPLRRWNRPAKGESSGTCRRGRGRRRTRWRYVRS